MKLIPLPHKVCGLTCMINGLEDLYEHRTGVRLPDWLLFYLSGMAGFVYVKNKNAPAPRMVFWGMQIARYQYEALADVVGFQWRMVSNNGFPYTLKCARRAIDGGDPALLGALDMYHLPYYERFYHRVHVPIHHVLMVGYDEERRVVLVQDCDRAEVLSVPYTDLEAAWNVNVPGLGKKNTFYTFTFNDTVASVEEITRKGLQKLAQSMLEAPVSLLGLKGMRKLAAELPGWPRELDARQLDASLRHLAEFTGFPPVPPNRLTGYNAPDDHGSGRNVFAALLRRLSQEYHEPAWSASAALFDQSAQKIKDLTDSVVDYLLHTRSTQSENTSLSLAAALVIEIADLEEQAFANMLYFE